MVWRLRWALRGITAQAFRVWGAKPCHPLQVTTLLSRSRYWAAADTEQKWLWDPGREGPEGSMRVPEEVAQMPVVPTPATPLSPPSLHRWHHGDYFQQRATSSNDF